jgi:hypothetical protein
MDKPVPMLVKKELQKGESIKWSGQPDSKEVVKAVAPLSFLAAGALATFASAHPLQLIGHKATTVIFLLIDLIPYLILVALILSPLYFLWRAGKLYYL